VSFSAFDAWTILILLGRHCFSYGSRIVLQISCFGCFDKHSLPSCWPQSYAFYSWQIYLDFSYGSLEIGIHTASGGSTMHPKITSPQHTRITSTHSNWVGQHSLLWYVDEDVNAVSNNSFRLTLWCDV
jgi:hypothetical protein